MVTNEVICQAIEAKAILSFYYDRGQREPSIFGFNIFSLVRLRTAGSWGLRSCMMRADVVNAIRVILPSFTRKKRS